MEALESLKERDKLYKQLCKLLKEGGITVFPSKESFLEKIKTFNKLVEGHKTLLTAIGKL